MLSYDFWILLKIMKLIRIFKMKFDKKRHKDFDCSLSKLINSGWQRNFRCYNVWYEICEHADETSRLGKESQREKPRAASFLFRNLLKTTSERLQNSPVIPLSSWMKWLYQYMLKQSGWNRENNSPLTIVFVRGIFLLWSGGLRES